MGRLADGKEGRWEGGQVKGGQEGRRVGGKAGRWEGG